MFDKCENAIEYWINLQSRNVALGGLDVQTIKYCTYYLGFNRSLSVSFLIVMLSSIKLWILEQHVEKVTFAFKRICLVSFWEKYISIGLLE